MVMINSIFEVFLYSELLPDLKYSFASGDLVYLVSNINDSKTFIYWPVDSDQLPLDFDYDAFLKHTIKTQKESFERLILEKFLINHKDNFKRHERTNCLICDEFTAEYGCTRSCFFRFCKPCIYKLISKSYTIYKIGEDPVWDTHYVSCPGCKSDLFITINQAVETLTLV